MRGLLDVAEVGDAQLTVTRHDGNLLILQVDDLVGILDDGGGIAAQEELRLAVLLVVVDTHADDEGAAFAGANQLVGVATVEDGNGIGTDDALQGQLHRCVEVAFVGILSVFHQLHQHLGVGLGAERHAVLLHLDAQRLVVLDDAVVYKSQIMRLREMRMGVGGVGLAVGGPTGVGNAYGATDILVDHRGFEGRHLSFGLVDREVALGVNHRHTGTVIATVFKSVKPLY